ncbi:MAG: baseplate J/gp47 family protein, partial [Pyramidobacter sp.]|nr:baseplate J/gp47 family protein [Pyramidobacter sp.]
MALKRINYTGIDFESIVASVVARMRTKYGSQWNDEFADGLATMLIEAFADVCDMNLFYLDQRANECFLATAKERVSVIALCKAIGYAVQGAKPAQADLTFALQGESSGSVRVPAGTQIETEGGVMFETTETKYLSSSTSSVTISARQGETLSMTAYSNGEAKQRFALDRNGVISIASVTVN